MSLNKQGPGKIDWTDYTWSPIAGCLHGCEYCSLLGYDRRFRDRGVMFPQYRPGWITKDLAIMQRMKPSKIFVGYAGDMWGDWVPEEWILSVLEVGAQCPQHTFQFLTKNPKRYADFPLLSNAWYGTTDDGTLRTEGNISELVESAQCPKLRFVSFEPLLGEVFPDLFGIQWVIIGADSNRGAKKPPDRWADHVMYEAVARGVPVWVKDNYRYPERCKCFPLESYKTTQIE
ncbi:MAG TPA: DUF5131 family protein [bacterium]|nr:DUF5131 family protein [bacterium]